MIRQQTTQRCHAEDHDIRCSSVEADGGGKVLDDWYAESSPVEKFACVFTLARTINDRKDSIFLGIANEAVSGFAIRATEVGFAIDDGSGARINQCITRAGRIGRLQWVV